MPIGQQESGVTSGVKFVTSTVGNTVGGVTNTVGGVVGALSRRREARRRGQMSVEQGLRKRRRYCGGLRLISCCHYATPYSWRAECNTNSYKMLPACAFA